MVRRKRLVMAVLFCGGWLLMLISGIRAADAPKLPQITDAQRAKFWRAAKDLAEWQARLIQAQAMAERARAAVDQARAELAATCGDKQVLAETQDGEPTCQPKPEPKSPAKESK